MRRSNRTILGCCLFIVALQEATAACSQNTWAGWAPVCTQLDDHSQALPQTHSPLLSLPLSSWLPSSDTTSDGEMLTVVGGSYSTNGSYLTQLHSDVWGSRNRGRTWSKLNSAPSPFKPRWGHAVAQLGSSARMVIVGGLIVRTGLSADAIADVPMNDVWRIKSWFANGERYDASTWELIREADDLTGGPSSAPFEGSFVPRGGHCLATFDDGSTLVVWSGVGAGLDPLPSDCWISTNGGTSWRAQPTPTWSPRAFAACTTDSQGLMYMIGGRGGTESAPSLFDGLYLSLTRGASWLFLGAFPGGPRSHASLRHIRLLPAGFGFPSDIVGGLVLAGGLVPAVAGQVQGPFVASDRLYASLLQGFAWFAVTASHLPEGRYGMSIVRNRAGLYAVGGSTFPSSSGSSGSGNASVLYLQGDCIRAAFGLTPSCIAVEAPLSNEDVNGGGSLGAFGPALHPTGLEAKYQIAIAIGCLAVAALCIAAYRLCLYRVKHLPVSPVDALSGPVQFQGFDNLLAGAPGSCSLSTVAPGLEALVLVPQQPQDVEHQQLPASPSNAGSDDAAAAATSTPAPSSLPISAPLAVSVAVSSSDDGPRSRSPPAGRRRTPRTAAAMMRRAQQPASSFDAAEILADLESPSHLHPSLHQHQDQPPSREDAPIASTINVSLSAEGPRRLLRRDTGVSPLDQALIEQLRKAAKEVEEEEQV